MSITERELPPVYALFPRPGAQLRRFLAGESGELLIWDAAHRLASIKAVSAEEDLLLHGGLYAHHRLNDIPVTIDPLDIFAANSFCPPDFPVRDRALEELAQYPFPRDTHGHIALDYRRVLTRGIKGLLEEITLREASLQDLPVERCADALSFYQSVRLGLEGVCSYATRYREEALRLAAAEGDPLRYGELVRIAQALARVPFEPAESFYEAMQSFLICHFAVHMIECTTLAFGRIDLLLHDFYQRDLAAGRVTREEAAEWMQIALVKSSELVMLGDGLVIGGSLPDGTPFWNDLTCFVLDGMRALKHYQPQVIFRYAPGHPRSLLHRAFSPLRDGVPQPAFFNDEVCVPALTRVGFTEEHARDYVVCNCAELSSAGRSDILSGYLYHNLAKPIEVLLNGGKPMVEETYHTAWPEHETPDGLVGEYATFTDFQQAYANYLAFLLQLDVKLSNERISAPLPFPVTLSSAFLEGCLERGIPAHAGGTIYHHTFPNYTGLVTAADSLVAIRRCVYEEHRFSLTELAEACRANYAGYEDMRRQLLNCPKYGNGDEEADEMLKWLYDFVAATLETEKNSFGFPYAPCYFGEQQYGPQADDTAATPDGRRHGEAISATLGGDQGRDRQGITALLLSATSFDHTAASGGLVANVTLDPQLLQREDDTDKVIDLMLTYFAREGMQLQFNCISPDLLREAQQCPVEHRHILVRVAGFSGYFVDLHPAIQQQIIDRVDRLTVCQ